MSLDLGHNPTAEGTSAGPAGDSSLVYDDFRLLIEGSQGEYRVSVLESPAGEISPEKMHWDAQGPPPWREADLRRLGTLLFDAFFPGAVRELYRESLALTRERGRGLRIKLVIDSSDLAAVPWELLYDQRPQAYLALSSRTPVVRHQRIPQGIEPLGVDPPLRILGAVASPSDLPPLDVEKERRLIETALADMLNAGLVELKWLNQGTWEDLQKATWQKWHVFHFIGHGDYDPEAGGGYLVFENGEGRAHQLPAGDLGLLLRGQTDIRLAVLNSCKGAATEYGASVSSTSDVLSKCGMGGVIAMQNPISDQAAITFARILYLALAKGLPVDAALGAARMAMRLEHNSLEWWTPVLQLRARDGVLFRVTATASGSHRKLAGSEYLEPGLDESFRRVLRRRRWWSRVLFSWLLLPLPVIGYLVVAPVSRALVEASVTATGLSVVLASPRELFSDLPRLRSLTASGFERVVPSGSIYPIEPGAGLPARLQIVSKGGENDGIFLQGWSVPAESRLTLDHPAGARPGEYHLSLLTSSGWIIHTTVAGPVERSLFDGPFEAHDAGTGSPMSLFISRGALHLELEFARASAVKLPILAIQELELIREEAGEEIRVGRSTLEGALVRFPEIAGPATVVREGQTFVLSGIQDGSLEDLGLADDRLSFVFRGRVRRITIGRETMPLPSKLEWVVRVRPYLAGLGAMTYVLLGLAGLMSRRSIYVRASKK